MDFHEEEHYDHEEEEEEEEEEVEGDEDDDDVDAARTTYENSLNNPTRVAEQATEVAAGGWGGGGQLAMVIMYKDCRKNHAVRIGKHAVDGCGEFLPSGPEGTLDALICAVCTCHRNFHRKFQLPPPPNWYLRVGPTPARPLDDDDDDDDDKGGGSSGKRHRTKFTEEQRERMVGLAEKLGWSIQKHDEAEVERFCSETGVGRQVLKVWMHNNKHTIGKKP